MALKLFIDAMSQPCRSVMLFLECTGIPHTQKLVNIAKGEHLSDEFKLINPTGKVPAIEHNGFTLFESEAILKYLCSTYTVPDHWYPHDLHHRAKIDEYLSWHHTSTRMGAALTFRKLALVPMLTGKPPGDASKYLKILESSVDMLESYFLKNTNYISGDDISIADLMALEEFIQLEVMGKNAPPLTPKVIEWKQRCIERTQPHYDGVHIIYEKVKQKFASSKL